MQQTGGRGSGKWRPIGWDEAITLISSRLSDLRSAGTPEALVLLDGQESVLRKRMTARFARSFGTPNHIRFRILEPDEISLTHQLMQGGDAPLGYDLSHAAHILCFGTGLLESWISPVQQMRAFADLHSGDLGQQARVVVVRPRLSMTAARADRWVPIQPGTEGALAMGIAHVMLRESLYDKSFVEERTSGFEDWTDQTGRRRLGFKNLVLSEYNPLAVSETTGVRAETIMTLAREFAASKPALAIGESEYSRGPNDFYDRMAIHALNALTGNLAGPGTFSVQGSPPTTPTPEPPLDEIARASLRRPRVDGAGQGRHFLCRNAVQALPAAIDSGRPYPVGAVLLLQANPVFAHPAGEEFARALGRVPFVVSVGSLLDETAELADLCLPEATFLERWDVMEARQFAGFSLVSVGEPAIPAIEGARDSLDVLMQIASQLGGTVASAFPWRSTEDLVREACRGLFEARRGYVVADPQIESFRRILESQGFRDPEFATFEEFWAALLQRGAWWDPTDSAGDPDSLIRTGSGRFEFYSRRLEALFSETVRAQAGDDPAVRARVAERLRAELGIQADGDRMFLPHHEPQPNRVEQAQFPLKLQPFLLLTLGLGRMANSPWIQENPAVHVESPWDSWVEVNPVTAQTIGVGQGDLVWIESPKGRVRTRVRLFEGAMPGTVGIPLGQGHDGAGSQSRGRGANPMELVEDTQDSRTGMAVLGLTPVRVTRA